MKKQTIDTALENNDTYCHIFKILGWLDSKGFGYNIIKIEAKESDKSFIKNGKRISKDKLLKIDTIYNENHKTIRYITYCRDGEQQKALDIIKAHIIKKVKQYKSEIDELYQFVC